MTHGTSLSHMRTIAWKALAQNYERNRRIRSIYGGGFGGCTRCNFFVGTQNMESGWLGDG